MCNEILKILNSKLYNFLLFNQIFVVVLGKLKLIFGTNRLKPMLGIICVLKNVKKTLNSYNYSIVFVILTF
jgi:hypothetical protein